MTRRLDATEFAQTRRLWLATYMPVNLKDLSSWRKDVHSGLAVLRYMEVVRVTTEGPPESQIDVRCTIQGDNLPFEPVQADLERIWRDTLSEGLEAIHMASAGEVLGLSFAAITRDKSTVTGRITVART